MELFRNMLRLEADTEEMREAARNADRPYATLTPIVPIRFDETDSWFGGKPRLPKDTLWPDNKGVPLRFACQINLSHLPSGLWSGAGPRDGWLVVFLHPETHAAEVLHVRGEVEDRDGPGQMTAQWARTYAPYAAKAQTSRLPRWPVNIQEARHARPADWRSVKTAGKAWTDEKFDLANAAIHPFDKNTLIVLLEALEKFFIKKLKLMCSFPVIKKTRQDDLDWMQETKVIALQNLEKFYKIEGIIASSRYKFDYDKVAAELLKIANFSVYTFKYQSDDEEGYCCLDYGRSALCEIPIISSDSPSWWTLYIFQLYWHCICAYTKDPTILHPALRERMEHIWLQQAEGFHGAMGHAPQDHIYTPHGPETDTEVLLELPTSAMQGWIWGDTYSIVLLIKRQALSQGNFADIRVDITN